MAQDTAAVGAGRTGPEEAVAGFPLAVGSVVWVLLLGAGADGTADGRCEGVPTADAVAAGVTGRVTAGAWAGGPLGIPPPSRKRCR